MTPTADDDFRPAWWLRNPHVQSMLASSSLRRRVHGARARRLERDAEWVTLDCGGGVRLAGCRTVQTVAPQARGLAVLFHGWEGSARSTYLLQTGARLLEEGWDVFRLNFRDHGDTHALNPGIFHSCRIDEVVGALGRVQQRYPARAMAVVGFSLGGNFALRAALRAPGAGIDLAHVIAVCPVIDPRAGLFQVEHAPRPARHAAHADRGAGAEAHRFRQPRQLSGRLFGGGRPAVRIAGADFDPGDLR
jgi:predicted alpha/beta-fold hydrolase